MKKEEENTYCVGWISEDEGNFRVNRDDNDGVQKFNELGLKDYLNDFMQSKGAFDLSELRIFRLIDFRAEVEQKGGKTRIKKIKIPQTQ